MNSKNKGNTFERKIAKVLSDRFSSVLGIDNAFRRNIDSGSYFGGKNQTRMESHDLEKAEFGDIVAPNSFLFSIECKHYKKPPTFSAMVDQKCKMIDDWIAKAKQDAENSNREMCLIMKFNNVKETVLLEKTFGTLVPVMLYQGYYIVTLESFLAQADDHFFSKK